MKNDMQDLAQAGAVFPELEDIEELDNHRNAPKPSPDCLYGLVGDVARAGSESTEANAYAIAANFLAYLGVAVGRGPFLYVGNTKHHARIFALHVGRSGRGRKGDATSLLSRIAYAVAKLDKNSSPQIHRGGLSSREGMVLLIHDGYSEGKEEVPAIEDKRLLVIESEFANVLHQGKREGNTLSAALRDCWDGVDMKPATKTNRLYASNPHVGMVGAITPGELLGLMASRELTNGFANRFLVYWAERTKMLAFPRATPQEEVDALAERVLEVLNFCNASRWVDRDAMQMKFTEKARTLYSKLYHSELNDNKAGDRVTALIERRAPMLLRLAMIFALTDLSTDIDVQHINAARAWIKYSVDSVKFIFASAEEEQAVAETSDTAAKIVEFLKNRGTVKRSEITADCFSGHAFKSRIDPALDELLSTNPPTIEVHEDRSGKGRPTKFYKLCAANNAIYAKNEAGRGFAADFDHGEVSEVSEVSPAGKDLIREVSTACEETKPAGTRMDASSSLKSLNSRPSRQNPQTAKVTV